MQLAVLIIILAAIWSPMTFAALPNDACIPPAVYPGTPSPQAQWVRFGTLYDGHNRREDVLFWREACMSDPAKSLLWIRLMSFDGTPFCLSSFEAQQSGKTFQVVLSPLCMGAIPSEQTFLVEQPDGDHMFNNNGSVQLFYMGPVNGVGSTLRGTDGSMESSSPGMASLSKAVEFYNGSLDHYFISGSPDEIAALDSGRFSGWSRTGYSFNVYLVPQAGSYPVCRFYIPPKNGDSHFYSASPDECQQVAAKFPSFEIEAPNVFYVYLPNPDGSCESATAVYRLWNKRADTNHRYTTDVTVRADMIARGWVPEGYGTAGVSICAPEF